MILLEAVLAFAVTMLFFAVLVSVAVETLHRVFGLRESGLQLMVERMFDTVIWPRLRPQIEEVSRRAGIDASRAGARERFVAVMIDNPVPAEGKIFRITGVTRPRRLSALPTVQFVQRLADTDVGRSVVEKARVSAGGRVDGLVTDLARRYESLGANASEYFGRRAKLVSVAVAVVVAVVLNVDALQLFRSYLADEQLTAGILARSREVQAEFTAQAERMESAVTRIDAGTADSEAIEAIRRNSEQLLARVDAMTDRGFPVGWEYFPYCQGNSRRGLCGDRPTGGALAGSYLLWLVGVLLGGVLIGLGGPFWFDAIRSLTLVLNIARTGSARQQAQDKEDARRASSGIKPKDVVDAFETAIRSTAPRARRALLRPDGLPEEARGAST